MFFYIFLINFFVINFSKCGPINLNPKDLLEKKDPELKEFFNELQAFGIHQYSKFFFLLLDIEKSPFFQQILQQNSGYQFWEVFNVGRKDIKIMPCEISTFSTICMQINNNMFEIMQFFIKNANCILDFSKLSCKKLYFNDGMFSFQKPAGNLKFNVVSIVINNQISGQQFFIELNFPYSDDVKNVKIERSYVSKVVKIFEKFSNLNVIFNKMFLTFKLPMLSKIFGNELSETKSYLNTFHFSLVPEDWSDRFLEILNDVEKCLTKNTQQLLNFFCVYQKFNVKQMKSEINKEGSSLFILEDCCFFDEKQRLIDKEQFDLQRKKDGLKVFVLNGSFLLEKQDNPSTLFVTIYFIIKDPDFQPPQPVQPSRREQEEMEKRIAFEKAQSAQKLLAKENQSSRTKPAAQPAKGKTANTSNLAAQPANATSKKESKKQNLEQPATKPANETALNSNDAPKTQANAVKPAAQPAKAKKANPNGAPKTQANVVKPAAQPAKATNEAVKDSDDEEIGFPCISVQPNAAQQTIQKKTQALSLDVD